MKTLRGKTGRVPISTDTDQEVYTSQRFTKNSTSKLSLEHSKGGHIYSCSIDKHIPIICHDDRLVLRGQKNEVGLHPSYKNEMPVTGEIMHYFNPQKRDCLPITADEEELSKGYRPVFSRHRRLSNGVTVYDAGSSYIDIRIDDLWVDIRSRYVKSLQVLEKAEDRGILLYRATSLSSITGLARKKARREVFRRRLKSVWKVAYYEHDLLITDAHIGKVLLSELRPYDQANQRWRTIYLRGFSGKSTQHVKVYDTYGKHGFPGIKIEVMLRKDYLKSHGLRSAFEFKTQPEIQARISKTLRTRWKCDVFEKAPQATKLLMKQFKVGTMEELLNQLLDPDNTLTMLKKEVKHIIYKI